MLPEQFENLITYTTAFNEETMAEKLAEVISVVLPKIFQREIAKLYLQKEKSKKL